MNYYISDLHIGHKNAIRFDNRPFFNLSDMKNTIISNWNSVVTKNDNVYILGDMFWRNEDAPDVLSQLSGNKYLIRGNHDRIGSQMKKYLIWVKDYAEIKDGKNTVVLCHYPIAHWKNADHGAIHLYGHVHAGRDNEALKSYTKTMKQRGIPYFCYNVGCMLPYMEYTPKTLNQIITHAGKGN